VNRLGLTRRSQLSRERSLGGVVVTVVLGLDFCWGSLRQRGAQPRVVEPVEHGELEVAGAHPRSFPVDEFGLVEALRGLGLSGCDRVKPAAVGAVGSVDNPADRDAEEVGGDRPFPAAGSSDRSGGSLGVGRQEVVGEPVARQDRCLCQGPGLFEQVRGTLNDR